MPAAVRRVIVLGSTGSIGVQTLEVIDHLNGLHARGEFPVWHEVVGLAVGKNLTELRKQHERLPRARAAIAADDPRDVAWSESASLPGVRWSDLVTGREAALVLVREVECDLVVSGITGSAGLPGTLEAVRLGRDVALANKETLVAAGSLVVAEARRTGAKLLPVDSEHAGLWACLQGFCPGPPPLDASGLVTRAIITASGGPFRDRSAAECFDATPDEALRHPNWKMGPKVTIDSATMMNKALELIEAHWLFGLRADQLGVLIHPQSVVHALVERPDGSVIAQLAPPDMRGPIHQALAYPERTRGCAARLDWQALRTLDFRAPDPARFPAVALATRVIEAGGTAGAILNAANEEAVAAFLSRRLAFGRIVEVVREVMDDIPAEPLNSMDDVARAESTARSAAAKVIRDA